LAGGASHAKGKEVAMKPFAFLAVVVFSLVAAFQLTRFALGWPVTINGLAIPTWVSAVLALFAAALALMLYRESRSR
jgi:hypothetical protein